LPATQLETANLSHAIEVMSPFLGANIACVLRICVKIISGKELASNICWQVHGSALPWSNRL